MESIGKYLQETREAAGLSIEEVSQQTRLKTYIIKQIEDDDYKAIGDTGFIKIMITTYCRFLQADTAKVHEKLVKLFDKPSEPPIKIDTAKKQKTVFIPVNAIYFVLLGLLVVFLTFFVIRLYRNDNFSFDAFRSQLATTTEVRVRTPSPQIEVEPDSLWQYQRQLFHELNNIQVDAEITESAANRMGLFFRNTAREEDVRVYNPERKHLDDSTDYVGEFIFSNRTGPLNPEL